MERAIIVEDTFYGALQTNIAVLKKDRMAEGANTVHILTHPKVVHLDPEALKSQGGEMTEKEIPAESASAGAAGKPAAQAVTNEGRKTRQAVVVIHGIGEPRPMDTLRSFVDAVLVDDPERDSKYRSKPDVMNESFEMRCLQAPRNRQQRRPLTDFYEYYWAHHMEGSKYTQVLVWLKSLMLRRPKQIPPGLKPVYAVSWALLLSAAALWGGGLFAAAGAKNTSFLQGLMNQKWFFTSGLAALIVQWIGSHIVLGYVADAARYLSPQPSNIAARNKIRSEGIQLLRTLHETGKYQRIVVVGHSLGSVIGYDLIRNLWVDLRKPRDPEPRKQTELKAFAREAGKLGNGAPSDADIDAFQQYQHRLWQEYRDVGIPWLITDFVTLGSPLAHGQLLMADDTTDFARKKEQYELPGCPPGLDTDPFYSQQYRVAGPGPETIRNVLIPHHGAPFSGIRWTNAYFPYRKFILGDLIGGPLAPVFGNGIRDIPVRPSTNNIRDRTLLSHIRYWTGGDGAAAEPAEDGGKPALETLRSILRLDLEGKAGDEGL